MVYSLTVTEQAIDDTINASDYYDLISPKLGYRFLSELADIYSRILTSPQSFSYISAQNPGSYRDVKLKSFPYVVIYYIHDTEIIVIAVLNTHRKPLIS